MKFYLNICTIVFIILLALLNFYLPQKSIVAYNTKNLAPSSVLAKK